MSDKIPERVTPIEGAELSSIHHSPDSRSISFYFTKGKTSFDVRMTGVYASIKLPFGKRNVATFTVLREPDATNPLPLTVGICLNGQPNIEIKCMTLEITTSKTLLSFN